VQQLEEWIGVDVYGECGSHSCGHVLNIQEEYDPLHSTCSQLVNSKYRSDETLVVSSCNFDVFLIVS
jgi:hypothetical protein